MKYCRRCYEELSNGNRSGYCKRCYNVIYRAEAKREIEEAKRALKKAFRCPCFPCRLDRATKRGKK